MTRARPARVAVLISGEGTNLQALIDAAAEGRIDARIDAVLSDRPAAPGLERARRAGIETRVTGGGKGREPELAAALQEIEPDLVVLAGFMRVLGPDLVRRHAGRMLNIHPSLLPRHRGLNTHQRVLESGDTHHGATVHFVTEQLDAGPRIIQYRIAVSREDTPESLARRVHRGEHIILPQAVGWFADGRLRLEAGMCSLDGVRLEEPIVIEEEAS